MVLPVLFICFVFIYATFQVFKLSLNSVKRADSIKQIKKLMKTALDKASGERLVIMKFNGSNPTLESIPYNFMSCDYEVYRQGKKPVKNLLSRVPTPLYILFLRNLLDAYIVLDPLQNENGVTEAIYDLARVKDESKGLFLMLNDRDLEPFGYISLKKADDFTNEDLKTITCLAAELTGLIN